jgi:formylglycine-generating enzyme required for sulfatase activity
MGFFGFLQKKKASSTNQGHIGKPSGNTGPKIREVKISAGSFMMGSEKSHKEIPVHKVTLDAFYVDTTAVTQKEFEELMGFNPSVTKDDGSLPVVNVTWYDAVLFCNARSRCDGLQEVYSFKGTSVGLKENCKVLNKFKADFSKNGYRLPTEAEWEYACRASTVGEFYWGDKMDNDYLWYADNAGGRINPVGGKKPNAWGLYDMLGNTWEYCQDWNDKDYYSYSPEKNPRGPKSGECRIFRGGGWNHRKDHDFSCSKRLRSYPDECYPNIGFRCARNA